MKKWRFISNQNSTIVGINDAGIETFTADMHRSLVRESVQNSLDAVIPGSNEPVIVEFVSFDMDRSEIPDVGGLQDAIIKCKNSNLSEPDALKFFAQANELLCQQTVKVLRISDHNTVGLEGSDTCEKGTGWSRLVKESGSSNKGQNSGGSFGIGKSASFACSDIRTVFYSSIDSKGLKSNFGVARLVSYEDSTMGGWTTGTGYYSENDKFIAIPELAEFDPGYKRIDAGTDIYVIGMHLADDFEKIFVKMILLDFIVAIIKGKLVVNVQGKIIDKGSLPRYISSLNQYESNEIRDLLEYYDLLTSKNPGIRRIELKASEYGEKYGFQDGECTLFLKEGEGLNRKILITRNAGMRIFEQDRISGSIEFTGILIIDGENMNEVFKKMEVPSHDAWEPGRCRGEEKYYAKILAGLRKYLKDEVKKCFGRTTADSMEAFGVSDFLPSTKGEDRKDKINENIFDTRINKLSEKSVEPVRAKTRGINVEGAGASDDGEEDWAGGRGHDSKSHSRGKSDTNSGTGGNKKDKIGSYKEIAVKKRMICINANTGKYMLSFVIPSTVDKGKLEFSLSGEQSDFELPIKGAKINAMTSSSSVESVDGNMVYLKDLIGGEMLKMEVEIEFDSYCMMEVGYYENKK